MNTGRNKMLNKRTAQFIKQKSGMIVPVWNYLIVNHSNMESLIIIIEQNDEFSVFDREDNEPLHEGLMLTDE